MRETGHGELEIRPDRRRYGWILLAACLVLIIFIGASQVLLPGIAESRLRSSLEENGDGVVVNVQASPAIKLLTGHADDVSVTMATARSGGGSGGEGLGDLLARTSASTDLNATVGELDAYGVLLSDVRLQKEGAQLSASAVLETSEIKSSLPAGLRFVAPDAPAQAVAFVGHLDAFGHRIEANFELAVDNGAIVVRPENDALAGILSYPVFQDDRIYVDSLSSWRQDGHLTLRATAHLVSGP